MRTKDIEKEEKKKKQILEGCFKLLLKNNINSITIDDIEKNSGVTRSNLFYYFKDKEEIFRATTEFYYQRVQEYFAFFFQKEKKSLLQFIHDYIDNWKNFDESIKDVTKDDFASVLSFFFNAFNLYPEFAEKIKCLFDQEQKCWEEVIKMAVTQKEIKDINIEFTAEKFQFAYMAITLQSYFLPYNKKVNKLFVHMINLYEEIKYKEPMQKPIF